MTSIRLFLIVIILSVVCLTNFIAALQGYRDSLQEIDRIEEQQLKEKAHTLLSLAKQGIVPPPDIFDDEAMYQIWQAKSLFARSGNAPDIPFFDFDSGFHFRSYEKSQWLIYLVDDSDSELKIIVATKHRVYSSLTEDVLIRTILPIIWVLPLIGFLVWGIVHVGLKPLRRLASDLDSRSSNEFSAIKNDRYTSELVPIVKALNGLFDRLGRAFEREKRFSADAAHELRTPLAAFKINLHNLSRQQPDSEFLNSLKRTADRMEHGIEQLLSLHKVSIDNEEENLEKVNLRRAVQDVIVEVYEQLDLKHQQISLEGVDNFIKAKPASIAILLRNLIDNASKYSPEYGVIHISLTQQDELVVLLVEDSGPGVPEQELERVLDRFYRVGGDHNNSKVRGSGLGLSIVSDIVRSHDANIDLSKSKELGGLAVRVGFIRWLAED